MEEPAELTSYSLDDINFNLLKIPDLGRVPMLNDLDGNPTIPCWAVYGNLPPAGRAYLEARARMGNATIQQIRAASGFADTKNDVFYWRKENQGMKQFEQMLSDEPWTAAHFLAVVGLPKAMGIILDVIRGTAKGSQFESAKFVINIADAKVKRSRTPPSPATLKGKGANRKLARLLLDADEDESGDDDDDSDA